MFQVAFFLIVNTVFTRAGAGTVLEILYGISY